jgi:hypothetical protein
VSMRWPRGHEAAVESSAGRVKPWHRDAPECGHSRGSSGVAGEARLRALLATSTPTAVTSSRRCWFARRTLSNAAADILRIARALWSGAQYTLDSFGTWRTRLHTAASHPRDDDGATSSRRFGSRPHAKAGAQAT